MKAAHALSQADPPAPGGNAADAGSGGSGGEIQGFYLSYFATEAMPELNLVVGEQRGGGRILGEVTAHVDSGAAVTVIPPNWFEDAYPVDKKNGGARYKVANGEVVAAHGTKTLRVQVGDSVGYLQCVVAPVSTMLLSVSALAAKGHAVHFANEHAHIQTSVGYRLPLRLQRGVYELNLAILAPEKEGQQAQKESSRRKGKGIGSLNPIVSASEARSGSDPGLVVAVVAPELGERVGDESTPDKRNEARRVGDESAPDKRAETRRVGDESTPERRAEPERVGGKNSPRRMAKGEGKGSLNPLVSASEARSSSDPAPAVAVAAPELGEERVGEENSPEGMAEEERERGESEEGLEAKVVRDPGQPTPEEVAKHQVTHVPYRAWCASCVMGRGRNAAHRALDEEKERLLPTVAHDFAFLGRDDQQVCPVLVSKSSRSQWIAAAVVPSKTSTDEYTVSCVVDALKQMGHSRFIHKSDQEPAMKRLKEEALKRLPGYEGIPEVSPVKASRSNGMIEVGVRTIEGLVRTHRDAVERSQGIRVDGDSPLVPWLVLWAAYVYNRFSVDVQGRTPYEKCKSKRFKRELLPFGEKVYWLPLARSTRHTDRLNKLENKWEVGHFLGIIEGSDEAYIGLASGEVVKARALKRLPLEQRKDPEGLGKVKGVPWKPQPASIEQEVQIERGVDIGRAEVALPPPLEPKPEAGAKRTYIRRVEVEKHGPTPGCPACASVIAVGFTQVAHSEVCRARMEERMQATEDGKKRLEETAARKRGRSPGTLAEQSQRPPEQEDETGAAASSSSMVPVSMDERDAAKRGREQADMGAEKMPRRVGQKREASEEAVRLKEEIEREIIDEIEGIPGVAEALLGVLWRQLGYDVHVSELYNPERFREETNTQGLCFGDAFDMKVPKVDGTPWDLSVEDDRKECKAILEARRPLLLIGSPMCTMFSRLMQLNKKHFTEEQWRKKMQEAESHLRFAFELYQWQQDEGRLWLHEHPLGASSWNLDFVKSFLEKPGVKKVRGDMCQWGMQTHDSKGNPQAVLKPTGWATNSEHLAAKMARRCKENHEHVPLMEGRAAAAAVYPKPLVKGILEGLLEEMRARGLQREGELGSLDAEEPEVEWSDWPEWGEEVRQQQCPAEKETYIDAISGRRLDPLKVAEAKMEELKIAKEYSLYEKVPIEECYNKTGKTPIGVKWVYVNKGDDENPAYRARLRAKEVKAKDPYLEGVFAPTPPIEGLRLLLSLSFTAEDKKREPDCIMVLDATRAHWHSPAKREVFVAAGR